MPNPSLFIKIIVCFSLVICCQLCKVYAYTTATDSTPISTQQEAIAFLNNQATLAQSSYWPKVQPLAFIQNLRKNIEQPLSLYEGRSTNFCAYAALSYLPLHDDPLGFVKFMVALYNDGKADYGKAHFEPTNPVLQVAGSLRFKGALDVRPADQIWFLALADHFKGYLNLLDKHYDIGDENKMWAAVNFAKFNRMVRQLFNYQVTAVGSDLIRPGIDDIYQYLSELLKTGRVALFVNNLSLYKKNHTKLKYQVPTHFIILLSVQRAANNKIAFTYWDYGGRSLQELSPKFLRKIIFGIAHINPKKANAN